MKMPGKAAKIKKAESPEQWFQPVTPGAHSSSSVGEGSAQIPDAPGTSTVSRSSSASIPLALETPRKIAPLPRRRVQFVAPNDLLSTFVENNAEENNPLAFVVFNFWIGIPRLNFSYLLAHPSPFHRRHLIACHLFTHGLKYLVQFLGLSFLARRFQCPRALFRKRESHWRQCHLVTHGMKGSIQLILRYLARHFRCQRAPFRNWEGRSHQRKEILRTFPGPPLPVLKSPFAIPADCAQSFQTPIPQNGPIVTPSSVNISSVTEEYRFNNSTNCNVGATIIQGNVAPGSLDANIQLNEPIVAPNLSSAADESWFTSSIDHNANEAIQGTGNPLHADIRPTSAPIAQPATAFPSCRGTSAVSGATSFLSGGQPSAPAVSVKMDTDIRDSSAPFETNQHTHPLFPVTSQGDDMDVDDPSCGYYALPGVPVAPVLMSAYGMSYDDINPWQNMTSPAFSFATHNPAPVSDPPTVKPIKWKDRAHIRIATLPLSPVYRNKTASFWSNNNKTGREFEGDVFKATAYCAPYLPKNAYFSSNKITRARKFKDDISIFRQKKVATAVPEPKGCAWALEPPMSGNLPRGVQPQSRAPTATNLPPAVQRRLRISPPNYILKPYTSNPPRAVSHLFPIGKLASGIGRAVNCLSVLCSH
ncbi:hypothetical protein H0H87_011685, partial [Tephrocybe sp. NHM501043]